MLGKHVLLQVVDRSSTCDYVRGGRRFRDCRRFQRLMAQEWQFRARLAISLEAYGDTEAHGPRIAVLYETADESGRNGDSVRDCRRIQNAMHGDYVRDCRGV